MTNRKPRKHGNKNIKHVDFKVDNPKNPPRSGDKTNKHAPNVVKWPQEYAEFSTHATETAVSKTIQLGAAKTKLRKALRLLVAVVTPTDIDDEFGDGAQNAYKIIKSLTSGARFYEESTLYAYRMN